MLHSTNLQITGATNACVPQALAILTGVPAQTWLERIRDRNPKTCDRSNGVASYDYVPAARAAGYRMSMLWGMWGVGKDERQIELHRALALLRGRKGFLVVKSGGRRTHAIAAEGFIVADNGRPTPTWWGDWLSSWEVVYSRGFRRSRIRSHVVEVYLFEEASK